jgi:MFS family permease
MDKGDNRRLILPSLLVATFSTYPLVIVISVLLVEISKSFGVPVGLTGMLQATLNGAGLLGSFGMGMLAVKYPPRRLLQMGLLLILAASVGGYLAPTFSFLIINSAVAGLGMVMVIPMANSLVAEYYPVERRSHIMGYMGVAGGFGFLIGGTVVGILTQSGGWRFPFLVFGGVISLLGFVACYILLPPVQVRDGGSGNFLEGLRSILRSRSAAFLLTSQVLTSAAIQGLYLYSFSFIQENYGSSVTTVGLVFTATALFFMPGSLITGKLVDRYGRKVVTILGVTGFSIFTALYVYAPDIRFSVVFILVGHFFDALRFGAFNSFALELIPQHRGTMMSLSTAGTYLGYSLGASVGGLILLQSSYTMMATIMAGTGLLSATIIWLTVEDPLACTSTKYNTHTTRLPENK